MQKGERRPKSKPNQITGSLAVRFWFWFWICFCFSYIIVLYFFPPTFNFSCCCCFLRGRAYFLVLCRLFFFVVLVLKNEFPTLTPGPTGSQTQCRCALRYLDASRYLEGTLEHSIQTATRGEMDWSFQIDPLD